MVQNEIKNKLQEANNEVIRRSIILIRRVGYVSQSVILCFNMQIALIQNIKQNKQK